MINNNKYVANKNYMMMFILFTDLCGKKLLCITLHRVVQNEAPSCKISNNLKSRAVINMLLLNKLFYIYNHM